MLMLGGTNIVSVMEAAGARHGSARTDTETEPGPTAEGGMSGADEWEGWDMGDKVAGTGLNLEEEGAGTGAGTEAEAGARAKVAAPGESAGAGWCWGGGSRDCWAGGP